MEEEQDRRAAHTMVADRWLSPRLLLMSMPPMYQPDSTDHVLTPHRQRGRHQYHVKAEKDEMLKKIKKSCSIHCQEELALRPHSP